MWGNGCVKNAKVLTHDNYKSAGETQKFLKVGQSLHAENTSHFIFLCWPQGQAAVGRCTLQSCLCSHVLQTVSRFSQWIALYWWGEKKTHKNPRKKIQSSRPHISTSPVQRARTFQSQHFSSLSGLRGWGGGVWNLSSVYKWNQDKAECFLLSSTQWQIQTTRSPPFLLSGPEIGWEQDLKDTTSTFFSLHHFIWLYRQRSLHDAS